MKNILALLTLLFCLFYSQVNIDLAEASPANISSWKTLNQTNYSIRYPSNWNLEQGENIRELTATVDYLFAIFSPLESADDKFRENVNLVREDLNSQEIDLAKYSAIAESQIKSQMKNGEIIESRTIENGSRKYHQTIQTWDYESFRLKTEQYSWILDGNAYILTFTSEQGKFAEFKDIGENILNTFMLKI
jgi:hypothetical protein